MEVEVKTVEFIVRTTKLTRSLLKQIRQVRSLSVGNTLNRDGSLNLERAVCWVDGSVLGEEYGYYLVLKTDVEGVYIKYHCLEESFRKGVKQAYVVS